MTLPAANHPLDELEHPLLAKAAASFAEPGIPHERIRAVDDQVLLKVKVQRWRGAVWVQPELRLPWLVAAGWREDGSSDDFYAALEASAVGARVRYNETHTPPLKTSTYTGHLLPRPEDELRLRAEDAVRGERRLRSIVHDLVRKSLMDGHEHAVMLDGAALGIQALANRGHETYVAIRIIGSVPKNLTGAILNMIPGCDAETWMSDYAMPERPMAPEEQIWSNIMDPVEVAKFLDSDA